MARVTLTTKQRETAEEALADAMELEAQLVEAVEAGVAQQTELDRIRQLRARAEAHLRIFG